MAIWREFEFRTPFDPMTSPWQVVNVEAGKNKGSASQMQKGTDFRKGFEVHLRIALLGMVLV